MAVIVLLMLFMTWPDPSGPQWKTARPSRSRTGRTRSTSADAPPTMKTRLACSAPHCAPLTGASTMPIPRSASAAAVSSVSQGWADDVSSSRDPPAIVSIRPPGPSATSCTQAPSGSIVNTMSESAPTAAGLFLTTTLGWTSWSRSTAATLLSKTLSVEAGLGEVAGHRMTHDPEADEPDSWACHVGESSVSVMSQRPEVVCRSEKVKANGRSVCSPA